MATRPPSDAVVALRSLGRRFRGLFAGWEDDERESDEAPDDLAHRIGPDGHAAIDHVVAAARDITFLGRGLEQILVEDDPVLHPAVVDHAARAWDVEADGTVEERLAELTAVADGLAARVEHVTASDWARRGRVAGHDADVTALGVLWDAVDSAIEHLRAAERTLAAVRAR